MADRTYLFGYGKGPWGSSGRKTKAEILASGPFDHVHPEHMRRLFALADRMIDEGSDFGFGGGDREFAEQDAEFRRRHYKAPSGIWFYAGSWWQRHSWAAPYAPPGNSWHEAGASAGGALAVDALGDHVKATPLCQQYGLVNGIADELWHYQPLEIPRGRKYGQVWGALAVWPLPGSGGGNPNMSTIFEFFTQTGKHHYDSREPAPGDKYDPADPADAAGRVIPIPNGAGKVGAMITVTITQPDGPGWAAVYADAYDGSSCVNFAAGQTIANTTSVKLAANGTFRVKSNVKTHFVIDVVGLYHP